VLLRRLDVATRGPCGSRSGGGLGGGCHVMRAADQGGSHFGAERAAGSFCSCVSCRPPVRTRLCVRAQGRCVQEMCRMGTDLRCFKCPSPLLQQAPVVLLMLHPLPHAPPLCAPLLSLSRFLSSSLRRLQAAMLPLLGSPHCCPASQVSLGMAVGFGWPRSLAFC